MNAQEIARAASPHNDMVALHFLVFAIAEKGYAPSQVELAKHMGYRGVRAAQYRLERLEDQEFIERTKGVARGLRVTQHGKATLRAYMAALQ